MDSKNPWQGRKYFLVNSLELAWVADFNAKEVIGAARHEVTLADFGMFAYRGLEAVEMFFRLSLQGDVDNDRNRSFRIGCIQDRRVAADNARLFHQLDASQTRRRGKPDFLRQFRVALACVETQKPQNVPIFVVEGSHGRLFNFLQRYFRFWIYSQ